MLSEQYDTLISILSYIQNPDDIADIIIQSRMRSNADIIPFNQEMYNFIKTVAIRLNEVADDIQNSL